MTYQPPNPVHFAHAAAINGDIIGTTEYNLKHGTTPNYGTSSSDSRPVQHEAPHSWEAEDRERALCMMMAPLGMFFVVFAIIMIIANVGHAPPPSAPVDQPSDDYTVGDNHGEWEEMHN